MLDEDEEMVKFVIGLNQLNGTLAAVFTQTTQLRPPM